MGDKIKNFWNAAKPYLFFSLLSLAVGGLSALLSGGGMTTLYDEIVRPLLSPPPIVFPIVWTLLYSLMGIGAARVYLARDRDPAGARTALLLFALNLLVNFLWSPLFFGLRAFFPALLLILVLDGVVIRMTSAFRRVDQTAALLQIPYLLWLFFATYLTASIWILNR